MQKLFALTVILALTISVLAQAPQKMSYQAVIRNSSGQLVANHAVGMRISILQGSATGTVVYVETQTPTTNANGLTTIEIGGGTIVTGTFAGINWSTGTYFVKTETDPNGGTSYTITGTSQILSVPYAFFAKTAGNAFSGNYNDLSNKPVLWDSTYNSIKNRPDLTIYATKDMGNQNITNIATPVNAKDAATKAYVDGLIIELQSLQVITDIDGNHYKSVQIGNHLWMAENLKTTKFKDGTAIPLVTGNTAWGQLTTPGYCWYDNNETTNKDTYGALYNWYAVSKGKLCPNGWHVPTNDEWTTLTDYLGGSSIAGGSLKEAGTAHWKIPNSDATNESGFTALPGGFRYYIADFWNIGEHGNWWSSTQDNEVNAWYRKIDYDNSFVNVVSENKRDGFSVRCISDYAFNYEVHYIGESYGGGIVFYVHDNGQHGLIVATEFQSNGGWANAAKVCADYSVTVDGVTYDDWYLPSAEELGLLCSVRYVDSVSTVVFDDDVYPCYWSSDEYNSDEGIFVNFIELIPDHEYIAPCWGNISNKLYSFSVLAIRAF